MVKNPPHQSSSQPSPKSCIHAFSSVPLQHSKYIGPRKHRSTASTGCTCCPSLPVTPSTFPPPIRSLQRLSLSRAASWSYRQVAYYPAFTADENLPAARNRVPNRLHNQDDAKTNDYEHDLTYPRRILQHRDSKWSRTPENLGKEPRARVGQ